MATKILGCYIFKIMIINRFQIDQQEQEAECLEGEKLKERRL